MSFASPSFLWYLLPGLLLTYWILPARWRNGVVAIFSLLFYTWGAGSFCLVLLSCMVLNYFAGMAMDRPQTRARLTIRRSILVTAVLADLSVLGVWKYAGFASHQVDALSRALGFGTTTVVSLALPIGISFFTFHHISYVVDVYRDSRPALRNPLSFVTYIAMFPQLIAGPIVRYHEIADQLSQTSRGRIDDFARGFPRFALGLAKKVIIADSIAPIADAAFAASPGDLSTSSAWIGALAYTAQIYFDFSGYSDMAIGLGIMIGFRLPENFDRPYSATSITDFWRRWHMSLSRWFRDYVYVPIGGNRDGGFNTYRNLIAVFLLTGFWHGANWTFLVWGAYHGLLLIIERATGLRKRESTGLELVARRAVIALLVIVGWVFFRAPNLHHALGYLKAMFVINSNATPEAIVATLTNDRIMVLCLALLVFAMPTSLVMGKFIERQRYLPATAFKYAIIGVAAPIAALTIASGTFSPFLYFQF